MSRAGSLKQHGRVVAQVDDTATVLERSVSMTLGYESWEACICRHDLTWALAITALDSNSLLYRMFFPELFTSIPPRTQ